MTGPPYFSKFLKAVKDKKPEMSSDGSKATFAQDKHGGMPIVWIKIGKYWYIVD